MNLTVNATLKWMEKMNEKVQANKEYLTELDQAIGDGDHGINMSRGFQEVVNKISVTSYETVSDCLKDVAMTLMTKVGGASGPLYGTAFLKMSISLRGKDKVDGMALILAIDEAVKGMIQRGKAAVGNKTMLDVWIPILNLFQEKQSIDWNDVERTAKNFYGENKRNASHKRKSCLFKRTINWPYRCRFSFLFLSIPITC